MPGPRATLRPTPDVVFELLESEQQPHLDLIKSIVTRVCELGPCQIGDSNNTRALAINGINASGKTIPQFFAVITHDHKGTHHKTEIGPLEFSIQVSFRSEQDAKGLGSDWVVGRHGYLKNSGVCWRRNDLKNPIDIESIIEVVARGRRSFE